jgi:hypothetical protein
MTLANRRDFLDALLVNVAERKQRRMLPLLQKRLARTRTLATKYNCELQEHEAAARADGLLDLDAAVAAFKHESTKPSKVPLNNKTPREELEVRTHCMAHRSISPRSHRMLPMLVLCLCVRTRANADADRVAC